MRSVKPWLYLFSTDDPHSLVVNDTHSQVRTATAVVRPSPRHASAKVAIILIHLLIGPGFDTRSGNILSFLLPLFQEGQLSVTGESMCTKYWLTA